LLPHDDSTYLQPRLAGDEASSVIMRIRDGIQHRIDNPSIAPWYASDHSGRNSRPTEYVLEAVSFVMIDKNYTNSTTLSPQTEAALWRMLKNQNPNGG